MSTKPERAVEDQRLKSAVYVIEASLFEQHMLWVAHSTEAKQNGYGRHGDVEWGQDSRGWLPTVGILDGRPVCLSLSFATINGAGVLFWEPTSEVVDHKQVDLWLTENVPAYARLQRCDAQNFHHAIHFIRDMRTPAEGSSSS